MTVKLSDEHHIKRGVALLAAAVAETLEQMSPGASDILAKNLLIAKNKLEEEFEGDVLHELEILQWANEFITGYSMIEGQTKPYMR